ncbi:YczI family protein [Ureibacillus aquaedulcis]|uniref:YczI family protein n=1 Tax=Ureibacillus aquaedulcis TaxID=3058421 RepID=A0ABT8GSV4_9BACL|nr:YczI family protein [Ureibacillus sp. BA0131]MDN4494482.1 YczI family protein [Ureibacillus sp. BA0131]
MKIIRLILAIIVCALSGYSLLTGEFGPMPYSLLLLGVMIFLTGITEYREKRKVTGILSFISGTFCFFVGIYTIWLTVAFF